MFIKYTAIELRQLVKYLEGDSFYCYICEAIDEGLEVENVYGVLSERYPEVYYLLCKEELKDLPLYVGGPYSRVVSWRLNRRV